MRETCWSGSGNIVSWSYPPEFLESLAGLGLAPTPDTRPSLVRDAVNDLYRYQLRAMRDRLRAGHVEPGSYHGLVIALRKRYWVLTLPLHAWERICCEGK
jgi:hypothetical protein